MGLKLQFHCLSSTRFTVLYDYFKCSVALIVTAASNKALSKGLRSSDYVSLES